jgi:hypothetical protein
VRLRSTENYAETNQNFIIKGNKTFYSNLFLFNAKNSAFELDDIDAFFFDSETFKINFHYLNAFKSSTSANSGQNAALFGNINLSNFIRTQVLVNRLIAAQPPKQLGNPRKSSEWLFEVFIVFKIDESFEKNIFSGNKNISESNSINLNVSKNDNFDKQNSDYTYEKSVNGEINNESSVIIGADKVPVLGTLVNERNYFDFEGFEKTRELNKINFNLLYGDPLDVSIRYGEQHKDFSKEEKIKKGKGNRLLNSVCYEITSLNLHSGSLKGK